MEKKSTLLIVDDAPSNIQLLAGLLKDKYQIKIATDGQRCLDLAQSDPVPDLILLDVQMPEMNGYEVCRHLQANDSTRQIPIIFVTGKDQTEDEEFGLILGAVDYIIKPYSPAIVEARVATHIKLKQQNDALRRLAMEDQLTGLYNRHVLMDVSTKRISQAHRHNLTLSVLMIDIDHFKAVNDEHGHSVGDAVLRQVAAIFKQQIRTEDVIARFGGEEFVIILDNCDLAKGAKKAELLRAALTGSPIEGLRVSASFGLAQLRDKDETFEQVLHRADEALYNAKNNGRNRVELAD